MSPYKKRERLIIFSVLGILIFIGMMWSIREHNVHVTDANWISTHDQATVEFEIINPHPYPVNAEVEIQLFTWPSKKGITHVGRLTKMIELRAKEVQNAQARFDSNPMKSGQPRVQVRVLHETRISVD